MTFDDLLAGRWSPAFLPDISIPPNAPSLSDLLGRPGSRTANFLNTTDLDWRATPPPIEGIPRISLASTLGRSAPGDLAFDPGSTNPEPSGGGAMAAFSRGDGDGSAPYITPASYGRPLSLGDTLRGNRSSAFSDPSPQGASSFSEDDMSRPSGFSADLQTSYPSGGDISGTESSDDPPSIVLAQSNELSPFHKDWNPYDHLTRALEEDRHHAKSPLGPALEKFHGGFGFGGNLGAGPARVAPRSPTSAGPRATTSGAPAPRDTPSAPGPLPSKLVGGGDANVVAPQSTASPAKGSDASVDTSDFISRLFKPGPFAGESIPARSSGWDFTAAERREINRIMSDTGCHTCGTRDPGTKSGNGIPDHQPVSSLNKDGLPQRLYPHCIVCSRRQGFAAARLRRRDE
jgi:hypothetical protein